MVLAKQPCAGQTVFACVILLASNVNKQRHFAHLTACSFVTPYVGLHVACHGQSNLVICPNRAAKLCFACTGCPIGDSQVFQVLHCGTVVEGRSSLWCA